MPRPVPTYELYGELLSGMRSDPVHHETIPERSARHDWNIRPHRHDRLAQIMRLGTAGVRITAGETAFENTGPLILLIPPGVVHGFRFPEHTEGDVVSLPLDQLDDETTQRLTAMGQGGPVVLTPDQATHFATIGTLMRQVQSVFQDISLERNAILKALARLIVLYIGADARAAHPVAVAAAPNDRTRHEAQAQAFCAAVEAGFADAHSVADYARSVGVSTPHLSRICRRILGVSPNALIRQRRMVEARRLLEFTRYSVADVALRAGFRDIAYFSRAFKADTGVTPSAFRRNSAGD